MRGQLRGFGERRARATASVDRGSRAGDCVDSVADWGGQLLWWVAAGRGQLRFAVGPMSLGNRRQRSRSLLGQPGGFQRRLGQLSFPGECSRERANAPRAAGVTSELGRFEMSSSMGNRRRRLHARGERIAWQKPRGRSPSAIRESQGQLCETRIAPRPARRTGNCSASALRDPRATGVLGAARLLRRKLRR
jgi:hypothetical protein